MRTITPGTGSGIIFYRYAEQNIVRGCVTHMNQTAELLAETEEYWKASDGGGSEQMHPEHKGSGQCATAGCEQSGTRGVYRGGTFSDAASGDP